MDSGIVVLFQHPLFDSNLQGTITSCVLEQNLDYDYTVEEATTGRMFKIRTRDIIGIIDSPHKIESPDYYETT